MQKDFNTLNEMIALKNDSMEVLATEKVQLIDFE